MKQIFFMITSMLNCKIYIKNLFPLGWPGYDAFIGFPCIQL
jgi:hypothetical protein